MILSWLALLFILLLGLIPGFLLVQLLSGHLPWQGDWLAFSFASVTFGLGLIGTVAIFLAEMGWFSIGIVLFFWVILIVGMAVSIWRRDGALLPSITDKMGRGETIFLLVWLPALLWLMLRPHQFVIGAADAGVYINLGANIAQSGSLIIKDTALADLDPVMQNAFLRPIEYTKAIAYRFPAFFVTDVDSGEIMPQFYPLHPVLQALVYDVGSVRAELLLPGLWGVLGAFAIYLTMRQLAKWPIAALTLVALSLNALQVWFARYPTSETLTQYFFWAGIWATIAWLANRSPARLWALLAGICFGMTFLTRIDMLFLLPLLLLIIVWQWRRKQEAWRWFAVSLLLLCGYSVVHALWQSQPYFYELYEYGVLSLLKGPMGLFLASVAGLIGLVLFSYFYEGIMVLLVRYERPLRLILIVVILVLSFYAWFIRSGSVAVKAYIDAYSTNSIPILDGENLIRLGWYLSPLGVGLGILGICLLIWYSDWQKSVLLLTGIFFALFYIWRIRNNPAQVYAMRRYVPVVMPLLVMGAAYFVDWVARQKPTWAKGVAVLIAALWLGSIIWSARGFISRVDYVGVPEQIAQLSAQMESGAIVIFNDPQTIGQGDIIGTPLKYVHGLEVFTLRDAAGLTTAVWDEALAQWQAEGRRVYWIEVADGAEWPSTNWDLAEIGAYSIETTVLEAVYDHKPTVILNKVWAGTIMEVQPSEQ